MQKYIVTIQWDDLITTSLVESDSHQNALGQTIIKGASIRQMPVHNFSVSSMVDCEQQVWTNGMFVRV